MPGSCLQLGVGSPERGLWAVSAYLRTGRQLSVYNSRCLIMTTNKKRSHPEDAEQRAVCKYLDLKRILYCHVPNGGGRSKIEAAIMKGLGVKAGVPDLLIFDRPIPGIAGCAIEMKSATGRVSPQQKEWLDALEKRGWLVCVARSAGEAIAFLRGNGY